MNDQKIANLIVDGQWIVRQKDGTHNIQISRKLTQLEATRKFPNIKRSYFPGDTICERHFYNFKLGIVSKYV